MTFLMTNMGDHLYILLAVCVSSVKLPNDIVCLLKKRVLCPFFLIHRIPFSNRDINLLLPVIYIANILCHLALHFIMRHYYLQKLINSINL